MNKKMKENKGRHHLYHSRTFLNEEYIQKDKTAREIAEACEVDVRVIYYWLCRFNLRKQGNNNE